ncbi:helix-turn-helix domain-containing protein [Sphingomonas sp. NSE70-1]|uniref:Helix-turn-helix domain-containing protein n=1 Tax=Sphingomonas caseinilyticus TaxID=2908205 RepID=A0ABT0RWG6_9SPHN|nr:helix-turn-helix domain-containing protein [Sphingomonas caseinilyticus]MCL6699261.1 helix-turn-helix domain-containing protein [Sphingomonas caseinilyticus]
MAAHRVVALVTPPVSLFEVGCVIEIFGIERDDMPDRYRFSLASNCPSPLAIYGTSAHLASIEGPEAFETADTIIVPAYPVETPPLAKDIAVIQRAHERGARILSICSGSFLLAAAGILDGKRATTHWLYSDLFRARYPNVDFEPDILYAIEGQVITSAGSAAGLDMMLDVTRHDLGFEACNMVARRLNIAPHRDGGQAQFVPRPVPEISDDRINRLVLWIRENCREHLSIAEMASRVAMSSRTFYRHFRAVTGHTPYDWILRERVGLAMQLLEQGSNNVDQVADAVGFSSGDALRLQFQKVVGIAPAAFRRMYGRTSPVMDRPTVTANATPIYS